MRAERLFENDSKMLSHLKIGLVFVSQIISFILFQPAGEQAVAFVSGDILSQS